MASTFFSNDDANQTTPTEKTAAQTKPTLTSIKCHPLHAESHAHLEGALQGHAWRRPQVTPPSLFSRNRPLWAMWMATFWCRLLGIEEQARTPAPSTGLSKVKSEFHSAMWDLQSLNAEHVRMLVEKARSLRDLWHLRADVFRVISMHRGQAEAQLRLDALDGHFPVRSSSHSEHRSSRVTIW